MIHNFIFRYRLFSFLFFFLLMASCNNPPETPKPVTVDATPVPPAEELVGLVVDGAGQTILLTVVSNGCTRKEDFKLSMQNEELVVERLRRDDCKRMPDTLQLRFGFKEAGLEEHKNFRVRNLFSGNLMIIN